MITTPELTEAYIPSVADDRTCVGCAYNLRGLLVTGNCPECGSPVEQSLHGNELWYSNPQWLKYLRWGMTLMIALTVANVLWHSAIYFLEIGFHDALGYYLAGIISLSSIAIIMVWLLTAREPRTLGSAQRVSLRMTIRVLTILSHVGGGALGIALITTTNVNQYMIGAGFYGLLYLCGTVGTIMLVLMLRGYAKLMEAGFIANWLLLHVVTSVAMGLPMAAVSIYESVAYFAGWDWDIAYGWYIWIVDVRKYAAPIEGLIFLPLAIIYHYKLEAARRRAVASRST